MRWSGHLASWGREGKTGGREGGRGQGAHMATITALGETGAGMASNINRWPLEMCDC